MSYEVTHYSAGIGETAQLAAFALVKLQTGATVSRVSGPTGHA